MCEGTFAVLPADLKAKQGQRGFHAAFILVCIQRPLEGQAHAHLRGPKRAEINGGQTKSEALRVFGEAAFCGFCREVQNEKKSGARRSAAMANSPMC